MDPLVPQNRTCTLPPLREGSEPDESRRGSVACPDEHLWGREEARMITNRRKFLKVLAGAAAATTHRLDVPPARAQANSVQIGALVAKAGVTAPVGESGLRGTQFAVDKINAAGGILGRKVELVVEEESNPKD